MKALSTPRNLNRAAIFLGFIGIFIAGTLTVSHLQHLVPPCGATAGGCTSVLTSPFATIGPVPVAALGLVAYVLLTALALYRSTATGKNYSLSVNAGFVLGGAGVLASVIFMFISLGMLREACIWCISSAATMVALFLIHAGIQGMPVPDDPGKPDINTAGIGVIVAVAGFILASMNFGHAADGIIKEIDLKAATLTSMLPKDPERIKGDKQARALLIEFADPNCPSCRAVQPEVKKWLSERPGLAFTYRALPLHMVEGHETSIDVCMLLEYAAENGKYIKAYETVWDLANTEKLKTRAGIIILTREIGLDADKFDKVLNEDSGPNADLRKKYIDRISEDMTMGKNLNITSTPTFVIVGEGVPPKAMTSAMVEGTLNTEPYRSLIQK